MRPTLRLFAACALSVCCNRGTVPKQGTVDAGSDGTLDTSSTITSDTAERSPDPPFVYRPPAAGECALTEAGSTTQASVEQQILELIQSGATAADQGMEVCDETPADGCAACSEADNPFLNLLRDLHELGLSEAIIGAGQLSTEPTDGLPTDLLDYVQRALGHPARHLTVTVSLCSELAPGACPELCANGVDDDNDGDADCADSECATDSLCTTGEICDNDLDDDGDGHIDCADHECTTVHAACVSEVCTNGADDDSDGLTDCRDPDCETAPVCGAARARAVVTLASVQRCADGTLQCGHHAIEPESLDGDCSRFPLTFFGTLGQVVDPGSGEPVTGATRFLGALHPEALDDVRLGIDVPLVSSSALPALDAPLLDAELSAWLSTANAAQDRLEARLQDPILDLRLDDANDESCGRVTGLLDADALRRFVGCADPGLGDAVVDSLLPSYTDPDHPDHIAAAFAFTADVATFTSGAACHPNPCATEAGTCTGDVLDYSITDSDCALPRPAGFVSGEAIAPMCEPGGDYPASIDCGRYGSACDADNATCAPGWRAPEVGDIVITEVFADTPAADFATEWVEFENVSPDLLRLNDCRFRGRDGECGELDAFSTKTPVLMAPGEIWVAGAIDSTLSTDRNNHGVQLHHLLRETGGIAHIGDSDVFRMECRLEGVWTEIDRVAWTGLTDRVAWSLDPDAVDAEANNADSAWCDAVDAFHTRGSVSSFGTPGISNPACP